MWKNLLSAYSFFLLIGAGMLTFYLNRPPKPLPVNASKDLFSAGRAFEHVRKISRLPHSLGTREHTHVRDYLLTYLKSLGLNAEIRTTVSGRTYDQFIATGLVQNIITVLKGKKRGKAVLLLAHYDSDNNSPGAADDGAGVAAILETARLLAEKGPLENDILFLLTDGEEAGLLGAKAFITSDPMAKDIGVVINLEGRGNSGPSMLFETNPQNGWIIKEYLKGSSHPSANSLSYEIYKYLPNDTDYTLFKGNGIPGLNHALIGGFANYHSMLDTPDNLDLGSLQHHGENLLSLARHFGGINLKSTETKDISYFNVIGFWVLTYPGYINLTGMIAVLVLCIIWIALILRREIKSWRGVGIGVTLFPILTCICFLIMKLIISILLLSYPFYYNFISNNTYYTPFYHFAFATISFLVFTVSLSWLNRKFNIDELLAGLCLAISFLCMIWYSYFPTASYIFFIPLFFFVLSQLIIHLAKTGHPIALHIITFLGIMPGIFILLPVIQTIFLAFGIGSLTPTVTIFIGMLAVAAFPVTNMLNGKLKKWLVGSAAILLITIFVFGHLASNYSKDKPLPIQLQYVFNEMSGKAIWVTDKIDEGNKFFFEKSDVDSSGNIYANAPVMSFEGLNVVIKEDTVIKNRRVLKLVYKSPRGASEVFFSFSEKSEVRKIMIEEFSVDRAAIDGPIRWLSCKGFGEEGITLTLELNQQKLDCWLEDSVIGIKSIGMDYPDYTMPGSGNGSNLVTVKKHLTL